LENIQNIASIILTYSNQQSFWKVRPRRLCVAIERLTTLVVIPRLD
jgi:hypothetical protein